MPAGRRPTDPARVGFVALVALVALVFALPIAARASSANVSIQSNGNVGLTLTASIPNGSLIREAMDGNFTPIVDALTSNTSQRASILGQIASAESTPFLGSLFGNRDGTVEAGEVTAFQSLLMYEASLLPTGSISGGSFLSFTLDGARATSTHIGGTTFENATGPADSYAPMGVSTQISYTFDLRGSSHDLALTTNVTSTPFPIALITGTVAISVTTPAGTSISGTSGFTQDSVTNDPLGWGPSSVAGTYTPTTSGTLSIAFQAAFPTGDVALALPIVAAVAIGGFLIYRRRKRRASPPA